MAGAVDICNIALTNLGEQKIVSLDENNERARLSKLRFDDVRDTVLRLHPWNCVTARTILNRDTDTPAWGYTYQYSLPSDCIRVLSIHDATIAYRIEGSKLHTDSGTIKLKYIQRPSDLTVLDANVVNLIGIRLAWELAEPLTAKTALKTEMWQKFTLELATTRSMDATEGTPEYFHGSTWLDGRMGAFTDPWKPIDAPAEGYSKI
jgi:hypothetical protein|tara:strand:- start:259 stop:876 length:618 start_codon:yes stop_codon:yes gene_type:complete